MTPFELANAQVARRVVAAHGGSITFDNYDRAMVPQRYFIPLAWCQGWGDRRLWKANCDKLCAFAALRAGLIVLLFDGYALGA